jgi:thiosulfate reductase cytochrome b subunit
LLFGGLKILDAIHLLIGASLGAFVFSHLYLATLGHTMFAHFIPMWTGWETDEH